LWCCRFRNGRRERDLEAKNPMWKIELFIEGRENVRISSDNNAGMVSRCNLNKI
jgi:hypothetical protein